MKNLYVEILNGTHTTSKIFYNVTSIYFDQCDFLHIIHNGGVTVLEDWIYQETLCEEKSAIKAALQTFERDVLYCKSYKEVSKCAEKLDWACRPYFTDDELEKCQEYTDAVGADIDLTNDDDYVPEIAKWLCKKYKSAYVKLMSMYDLDEIYQ